jgi:hypothetical protein
MPTLGDTQACQISSVCRGTMTLRGIRLAHTFAGADEGALKRIFPSEVWSCDTCHGELRLWGDLPIVSIRAARGLPLPGRRWSRSTRQRNESTTVPSRRKIVRS